MQPAGSPTRPMTPPDDTVSWEPLSMASTAELVWPNGVLVHGPVERRRGWLTSRMV